MIDAARFARIVSALVRALDSNRVGVEWLFMFSPDVDIVAWRPRAGSLVLQSCGRTVAVTPGRYRALDVIAGDALGIGETTSAEAAFSIALDYVTAPARAHVQHDHDAFAV